MEGSGNQAGMRTKGGRGAVGGRRRVPPPVSGPDVRPAGGRGHGWPRPGRRGAALGGLLLLALRRLPPQAVNLSNQGRKARAGQLRRPCAGAREAPPVRRRAAAAKIHLAGRKDERSGRERLSAARASAFSFALAIASSVRLDSNAFSLSSRSASSSDGQRPAGVSVRWRRESAAGARGHGRKAQQRALLHALAAVVERRVPLALRAADHLEGVVGLPRLRVAAGRGQGERTRSVISGWRGSQGRRRSWSVQENEGARGARGRVRAHQRSS